MNQTQTLQKQLKTYINKYVAFSESEIQLLFEYVTIEQYKKKDFILEAGVVCDKHYFVCNGLVRSYLTNEKGTDTIIQFAIENWWLFNFESFIYKKPSLYNIQTLEETTLLTINSEDLEVAFVKIPKLERFFRIITQQTLIAIQRKNDYYMKLSSRDKYKTIVDHIPDFLQRVPMYMIASYLDITPEYLSEIRKSL